MIVFTTSTRRHVGSPRWVMINIYFIKDRSFPIFLLRFSYHTQLRCLDELVDNNSSRIICTVRSFISQTSNLIISSVQDIWYMSFFQIWVSRVLNYRGQKRFRWSHLVSLSFSLQCNFASRSPKFQKVELLLRHRLQRPPQFWCWDWPEAYMRCFDTISGLNYNCSNLTIRNGLAKVMQPFVYDVDVLVVHEMWLYRVCGGIRFRAQNQPACQGIEIATAGLGK